MTYQNMRNIFSKKLMPVQLRNTKDPYKRRGGKKVSAEEVAHKVAWSACKKRIQEKG